MREDEDDVGQGDRGGENLPEPPEIDRSFSPTLAAATGSAALLVIVVLALFGVFGKSERVVHVSTDSFRVELTFPDRIRIGQTGRIYVRANRLALARPETIRVSIDPRYLDHFSSVSFTPDADSVWTTSAASISGDDLLLQVELRADQPGLARGAVRIATQRDSAEVPISSIIFP